MTDDKIHIHPNSPVHFEHWCGHDSCTKWGSFGKQRHCGTEGRCTEHLAADYLDGRDQRRNSREAAHAVSNVGLNAFVLKYTERPSPPDKCTLPQSSCGV
ncbi:hypothetical protein [Rhizobium herbae]|jgi:hypothetical protein